MASAHWFEDCLWDLFHHSCPAQAERAKATLQQARPRGAVEARAVIDALRWPALAQGGLGAPGSRLFTVLDLLERPGDNDALQTIANEVTDPLIALYPRLGVAKAQCLRILARAGQRDGLAFVAHCLAAPDGPDDYTAEGILDQIPVDTPHQDVILPMLDIVLTYPDLRAKLIVDFADRLMSAGRLPAHPAARHLDILAAWITSEHGESSEYALSACTALSLMTGIRADELLRLAQSHPDPHVRIAALASRVKRGLPDAERELIHATLDPATGKIACKYLEELGRAHLIPPEAQSSEHQALLEMVAWLM